MRFAKQMSVVLLAGADDKTDLSLTYKAASDHRDASLSVINATNSVIASASAVS